MVAARDGYSARWGHGSIGVAGYRAVIEALDWNRVLLEAMGKHLAKGRGAATGHAWIQPMDEVCGACIREVLLTMEDEL